MTVRKGKFIERALPLHCIRMLCICYRVVVSINDEAHALAYMS